MFRRDAERSLWTSLSFGLLLVPPRLDGDVWKQREKSRDAANNRLWLLAGPELVSNETIKTFFGLRRQTQWKKSWSFSRWVTHTPRRCERIDFLNGTEKKEFLSNNREICLSYGFDKFLRSSTASRYIRKSYQPTLVTRELSHRLVSCLTAMKCDEEKRASKIIFHLLESKQTFTIMRKPRIRFYFFRGEAVSIHRQSISVSRN